MRLRVRLPLTLLCAGILFLAACSPAATPGPTPVPTELPTRPAPTETPENRPATELPQPEPTALAPAALKERTFVINASQSIARYRVEEEFFSGAVTNLGKQLGFFTAVGWTRDIDGQIRLSEAEDGSLAFESGAITVEIRTLQSDESRRDQRIREQFLESLKFPFAEFVITSVEGFPSDYVEGEEVKLTLTGDLTIRETTNQETFAATARLEGDTLTGTAITEINMVDYGFNPPEIVGFMKAQDPATIEIELVAVEG